MTSNILIIYVIFLNKIINASTYNTNSLTATNRKDLVDIITSLNYDIDEEIEHGNEVEEKDKFNDLSDEAKEKKLQQMLWLLKKNLNALKLHDDMIKDPVHTGSRIYFIKNPEVIDKYKDYVKKKKVSLANAKSDLIKLKRRTKFRTESSDQSEVKDVDRTEMRDDKDTVKDKSDTSSETTQNIIDSKEVTQKSDKGDLEVDKEESYDDRTKEETAEKHNKRAQEEEPGDTVKREKISWSDANDKSVDKRQKNRKEKKDRYESFERKEKRFDDNRQDDFVSYKPTHKVNYRKPKSEGRKDYFSYGRTAIPFMGKKGIYEDK